MYVIILLFSVTSSVEGKRYPILTITFYFMDVSFIMQNTNKNMKIQFLEGNPIYVNKKVKYIYIADV